MIPNPWESSGGAPVEEMCVDASGWAVYWISLDATVRGTVVGHHAIIRRELLRLRAQIASVLSPFERLDFAQLSEDAAWYGEEAEACEKTLSNGNDDSDRALEWLRDAVLIGRVRFKLETIAHYNGISAAIRRRLISRLVLRIDGEQATFDGQGLESVGGVPALSVSDLQTLRSFIGNDFVCQYALRRISQRAFGEDSRSDVSVGSRPPRPSTSILSGPALPGPGWWHAAQDLDIDQAQAYRWPLNGNYLLQGPPGSGKTNILVLRASFAASSGLQNVRLITYTRILREFIASGCGDYVNFPASQVMTVAGWINEFLDEQGAERPNTRDLDEQQAWDVRLAALRQAAEGVRDVYDSLLVDEIQDLPGELIQIMHQLTPRLFMAGDRAQRIFEKDSKDNGVRVAQQIADAVVNLRYHYRIGQNICVTADRILTSDEPLTSTCRYNSPLGSRVEVHNIPGLEAQCDEVVRKVTTQLRTYGDEPIGVIAAKRLTCERIYDFIRASPLGDRVKLMFSSSNEPWYERARPICVLTLQAAKGSEFRAVHWVAADDLPYFTRQKAYVIATRAKTALDVYYSDKLRPVLAGAFSELRPPRAPF